MVEGKKERTVREGRGTYNYRNSFAEEKEMNKIRYLDSWCLLTCLTLTAFEVSVKFIGITVVPSTYNYYHYINKKYIVI